MVKPPALRTRSIGAKVTDEEYARLQELAGGQPLSEWMRDVLLSQGEGALAGAAPAGETVAAGTRILLAEVLALRTMLLNLFYALARGERITSEQVQGIIDRADADKLARAVEALEKP